MSNILDKQSQRLESEYAKIISKEQIPAVIEFLNRRFSASCKEVREGSDQSRFNGHIEAAQIVRHPNYAELENRFGDENYTSRGSGGTHP